MATEIPSFITAEQPALAAGDTTRMFQLAVRLVEVDAEIGALERMLGELRDEKNRLEHRELPEASDLAQTDRIGVPSANADIVIESWAKASIPEASREEAHGWLETNGYGDLIKSTLTLTMGRGDMEAMREVESMVREYLRGRNEPLQSAWDLSMKRAVLWQTLTAFVKEQVRDPEAPPLPLELLGATVGRVARIKKRKDRR